MATLGKTRLKDLLETIDGIQVDDGAISDGRVLVYDAGSGTFIYEDQSGSGGGAVLLATTYDESATGAILLCAKYDVSV